jgi:long-chain acyl-CoA synthetase
MPEKGAMTRRAVANEAEVPEGTLCGLFLEAVDGFGDRAAFRHFTGPGPETADLSYADALSLVRDVAGGLHELGIEPGERVAILAENRPEWALADYGCLLAGVVDVPIYATLIAEQIAYILRDSGARLVFAGDREQVAKARAAAAQVEHDVRVVAFDEMGQDDTDEDGAGEVVAWSGFLEQGRRVAGGESEDTFRNRALAIAPGEVATILYTSGTTGDPKGVMLTHQNLYSNVWACSHVLRVGPTDVTLSFLPLSHVFQRMVDYLLFSKGCVIAYAHDIPSVADDLKVVRPTLVVSVPRLYEKVYARVTEVEGIRARLVAWASRVAGRWADARLADRQPGPITRAQYALADRIVFRKIRDGVGGRLRFFVSGGAPLAPRINRFFYSVGLPILEGYGLTETSPVTNVNPPDRIRIGTVGPPVAGTEIRIADDGEILVRGPQVMKGYFNRPEETAAAIDGEGWFRTGDVGEITDEGYLKITDRKKDMILTAGGKNIAPQPIENRLMSNPFVEQVVMVGDRRKFASLLVVPDFRVLEAWAREKGIDVGERVDLLRHPKVQDLMEAEIMDHLEPFSGYERPKKLALLEDEFTIEDGTLTPTQKVKRRVVQERFATLIDRFYEEENEDRTVLIVDREAAR